MSSFEDMFDHLKIPLEAIKEATDSFGEKNIIKKGASGKIYKGKIFRFEKWIDIVARRFNPKSWRGLIEFGWEIVMLCSLKHPNLATVVGFCDENGERIIINKFEANGSLDQYLSDQTLTWAQRLKICLGIARALSYIHYNEGRDFSLIHLNIKSSKILLDEEWEPKLYGFELSKMQPAYRRRRIVLDRLISGTYAYVDPAYLKEEGVTHKSDLYSLGVVFFEVLCGRKAYVAYVEVYKGPGGPPSFSDVWRPGPPYSEEQSSRKPISFQGQISLKSQTSSQLQIPWQLETTPSFNDLRKLLLSWKTLAAAEMQTRSFRCISLEDQCMVTLKSHERLPVGRSLLAQQARSHYENKTLDEIIRPGLRAQMDSQSFKIFSEAAYYCMNEQRNQRPNIDRVINALEKALELQCAHEYSLALKESSTLVAVEGTSIKNWKGTNLEKLMIEFDVIENATKKFDQQYIIGSGAYGEVYKAELEHFDYSAAKGDKESELPKRRSTVAIKRIFNRYDKQGEEGFFSEIETLSSCMHRNIVSLLGFCHKPPHMILVYEHVPKGSLDDYLGNKGNMTNLTWAQRLRICIDIAHGLDYIHTTVDNKQKIIHRDIKSANILLGEYWEAKIADFGLSKLQSLEHMASTIKTTTIAGTTVYLDPEYERTWKLKNESDVYSFGVVLFEIVTGTLAYDFVYTNKDPKGLAPLVREHFKKGTLEELVDHNLKEESDEKDFISSKGPNKQSLDTFFKIGCQCLEEKQAKRPTMKVVIEELKKALEFERNPEDSVRLSFEALKLATQDFSLKIGHTSENVYKGLISRANKPTLIAVKWWAINGDQGEQEFLSELEILFEYKHENIIGLVGYCAEKIEKISVYEYLSNGSLDMHLDNASLTWTKRLKISIDVATGLEFLHELGSTQAAVIHRDIKSPNILLNGDWKAKIGGFGLSIVDFEVDNTCGTPGYVDPQYAKWNFLTKESDVYSFGVVLLEIMCGRIQDPQKNLVDFVRSHYDERKLDDQLVFEDVKDKIAFEGIKDKIVLKSLIAFIKIAYECLHDEREKRPTASKVVLELKKALELQEDIEIWKPKMPRSYREITQILNRLQKDNNVSYKGLYDKFSKGILLPDGKVCVSVSSNRDINEMVSATIFSYDCHRLQKWRSIKKSRFHRVVKIMDISNLRIQIKIKTQFLSPNLIYGVYMVFKFCDPRKLSSRLMYVNLKYQMRSESRHAYFATCGDDEWMKIELCRLIPHKKNIDFEVLLESLSRYYCGSGAIYVEGIQFCAIVNDANLKVKPEVYEEVERAQRVVKLTSDFVEQVALDYEEITELQDGEKLLSLSETNGKRCYTLPANMVLYESPNVKCFNWKSLAESTSRYVEVAELLSHQVFRIKCNIETQKLSPETDYACYLVYKLSEKCHGLQCPVKVRDVLLRENKEHKFLYFRSPRVVNLNGIERVPKQREDGLMEVIVWEFNSINKLNGDHIPMSLKLRCYEGTMSGLIVYGIEFRPI